LAAGHAWMDARAALDDERERTRPEALREHGGRVRHVRGELDERFGARDVDDERVARRASLRLENPAHGAGVRCICPEPIDGLGLRVGKGHRSCFWQALYHRSGGEAGCRGGGSGGLSSASMRRAGVVRSSSCPARAAQTKAATANTEINMVRGSTTKRTVTVR